jgi:hypothetical protein
LPRSLPKLMPINCIIGPEPRSLEDLAGDVGTAATSSGSIRDRRRSRTGPPSSNCSRTRGSGDGLLTWHRQRIAAGVGIQAEWSTLARPADVVNDGCRSLGSP